MKNVVRLSNNRRHREALQQTVVEGSREVRRCLDAGIAPAEAYVCLELVSSEDRDLVERLSPLFYVSPDVFAKMAVRGQSGGILIVIPYTQLDLAHLPRHDPAFFVVVEGAEKPGNVGAILRTADAAGVDGLILCSGGTDLHSPNVIRASLGTRFTVPVAEAPTTDVIDWLRRHQIRIFAAAPDASTVYTKANFTGPVAIVTGSEDEGLSDEWLRAANERIVIPMFGVADSLNLATSTALLLYEVVRQREVMGADSKPGRQERGS